MRWREAKATKHKALRQSGAASRATVPTCSFCCVRASVVSKEATLPLRAMPRASEGNVNAEITAVSSTSRPQTSECQHERATTHTGRARPAKEGANVCLGPARLSQLRENEEALGMARVGFEFIAFVFAFTRCKLAFRKVSFSWRQRAQLLAGVRKSEKNHLRISDKRNRTPRDQT